MRYRRLALVALVSTVLVSTVPTTGLLAPLGATSSLAQATPTKSAPTAASTTSSTAPRMAVKDLAMAAFGVAQRLSECESIAEKGLECLKEPTIQQVLDTLAIISTQIQQNQAQTMRALDLLQRSSDTQDLNIAVGRLDSLESHIFEAASAWNALSTCAEKAVRKAATCTGHDGGPVPQVPVAEGMRLSRTFFLGQMDKIDISLEQATRRFAGTQSVSGTDGLLHALWKAAKREQDRGSVAEGKTVKDPLRPPVVVTRSLYLNFVPTMLYYRDLVYLFGAL